MTKEPQTMKELADGFSNQILPFKNGDIIEVEVLEVSKTRILVDINGYCLGYIFEKEFSPDMNEVKVGAKILAHVLTMENSDGYCVLSLRRADKEKVSKILEEKFSTGGIIIVKCNNANRGGLLCSFGDYEGFLPVSQLASSHYPKVSSGDKDEILSKLRSLINQDLHVKILSFEPGSDKLIFSEKAAGDIAQQEKIKKYNINDIVEGTITGVVDFGLFVNLGDVEGLIHISEASWDHVKDLKETYKVGDKIKAQIISIDNNRISLSIKKLTEDPWVKRVEKFKPGNIINGEVTKITPFGAFVSFGEIGGLIHISELASKDPLEIGKKYDFKILKIEPELHKLTLALAEKEVKKQSKKQ